MTDDLTAEIERGRSVTGGDEVNVQEARTALAAQCHAGAIAVKAIMAAADAYALAAHCGACTRRQNDVWYQGGWRGNAGDPGLTCGDDWLCDVAEKILALGKGDEG